MFSKTKSNTEALATPMASTAAKVDCIYNENRVIGESENITSRKLKRN